MIPLKFKNFYRKLYWLYNNHKSIEQFELFKKGMYYGPITYSSDGIVTSNNADFINELVFQKAYNAAAATNPWDGFTLQWRVYIVCWFANHVKNLSGDFVECGVNTGAYARAVVEYINFNSLGKTFYLFDTFEGFVSEQITEKEKLAGIGKYSTAYKNVYEQVLTTFEKFNVKIIKGVVPDTLIHCEAASICFLSIDMNAVIPEIAAAEFFWSKLVKGGVLILDDYGFPGHEEQKLAFDKFASQNNTTILSLPTGQGIIIK